MGILGMGPVVRSCAALLVTRRRVCALGLAGGGGRYRFWFGAVCIGFW